MQTFKFPDTKYPSLTVPHHLDLQALYNRVQAQARLSISRDAERQGETDLVCICQDEKALASKFEASRRDQGNGRKKAGDEALKTFGFGIFWMLFALGFHFGLPHFSWTSFISKAAFITAVIAFLVSLFDFHSLWKERNRKYDSSMERETGVAAADILAVGESALYCVDKHYIHRGAGNDNSCRVIFYDAVGKYGFYPEKDGLAFAVYGRDGRLLASVSEPALEHLSQREFLEVFAIRKAANGGQ